jgi:hypothetical protein
MQMPIHVTVDLSLGVGNKSAILTFQIFGAPVHGVCVITVPLEAWGSEIATKLSLGCFADGTGHRKFAIPTRI